MPAVQPLVVSLQAYDVGYFATEDASYMPCGVASTYSRLPVAKFDATKLGQYQKPGRQPQKQPFWRRIVPSVWG